MIRFIATYILLFVTLGMAGYSQDLPDDFLPPEFHAQRRAALRAEMPQNSVAVLFANPVRNRSNDVDYVYHQDPDFYYLSGYREPHSILLIFSEKQTSENGEKYDELLFAQAKDPMREMWDGRRLGPEAARERLNIDKVVSHADFAHAQVDFRSFDKVLFFAFHNDVRDTRSPNDLYDLIGQFMESAQIPENFSAALQQVYEIMLDPEDTLERRKQTIYRKTRFNPRLLDDALVSAFMQSQDNEQAMSVLEKVPKNNLDLSSLGQILDKLREIKTPGELRLMRKAVDVSAIGQIEVMKAMHPGMSETEIQGIHEFVFKKYGSEYEGYPSIVGSGHNGCILHYIKNNRPRVGSDLVLMDLGAEYHGYTADVTRTIPADGTFSPEQKAIYNIVLEAQQAGFEECRVGNSFHAPHAAARRIIDQRLEELGIIEHGERHNYFPHGTSHYLGLDVHDRGTGDAFKAGTIITVEPGIYIPKGSPCDKKWWGIAVRIEDDILITEDGWENLSARAPRSVEEIEATMAMPSALDDFILPDLGR